MGTEATAPRVGILGGGQLGRFLVQACHQAGATAHVFCPDANSPASQWLGVYDQLTVAEYSDKQALADFANTVDVVTLEFENIPVATLHWLAEQVPVHPSPQVLAISQHRVREKAAIQQLVIPVTPFVSVRSGHDLQRGFEQLNSPCILKTATLGYDGKGQWRLVDCPDNPQQFFEICAKEHPNSDGFILEQQVDFRGECSAIVARNKMGKTTALGPFINTHANGILDVTVTESPLLTEELRNQVMEKTVAIAEGLEVIGLLCVEWFITNNSEQPLVVNEIAPRPHNSGHITLDTPGYSQFDRHIQALLLDALPTQAPSETIGLMQNLLGDLWFANSPNVSCEPDWSIVGEYPNCHVHLYGKATAKPGRKMGHLNWVGEDLATGQQQLTEMMARLTAAKEAAYVAR